VTNRNPISIHQKLRARQAVEPSHPYLNHYGLRENPFPTLVLFSTTTEDPRYNGEIYDKSFRGDEEKRFFDLFVRPGAGDEPLRLGFVRLSPQFGGRGNGKSAFLHRLMMRVNDQDWNAWVDPSEAPFALAVHALAEPKKQKNFYELARLIFETLARSPHAGRPPLFSTIDTHLRTAILFRMLPEDRIEALAADPPDPSSFATRDAFVALLRKQGLSWSGFEETADEALADAGGGVLSQAVADELKAAQWELGGLWSRLAEKSGYAWQKAGPEWLVNGLMPALIVAGYERFYLLLDEFERIYIEQTSKKRDEFLYSFRHYFFEDPSSAAVKRKFVSSLLTLHPSIDQYLVANWKRVGLEGMAPLSPPRMQEHSIPLDASTIPKLTGLVITYLDYFREGTEHQGTVYPFADGALEPAMVAAAKVPRDTLWYAHMILRKAATEAIKPPISREYVDTFVSGGERPPEDDEDRVFLKPSATNLQGE
jgi:hypothetical protein